MPSRLICTSPRLVCSATTALPRRQGVELGQLAFVALILLSYRAMRTLEFRWPRWAELGPAYAIGSLGAYWTLQRTVMMF